MSAHDTWLLEGSEPEWTDETAPHGFCYDCETVLEAENGESFCPDCEPRCSLEYSPVRASFVITDGRVEERAL